MQRKTGPPVRFERTEPTREAVQTQLAAAHLSPGDPPLSEPSTPLITPLDPAAPPDRRVLGRDRWAGSA